MNINNKKQKEKKHLLFFVKRFTN